ncbi:MAG: hypothetical protein WBQ17_13145 [Rhizomicrobium sp.]
MGLKIAGGVLGFIAAAALIFVGVALAGYAIAMALEPSLGIAGAAAIAAVVLLLPILCALVAISVMQASEARRRREARSKETEEAIVSVLSFLAGDRSWLAVGGAALVGAVSYFLRGRRK